MIEEKSKKKNKVIKGIALLGLFLMIFGISYALFRITLNGKKTNKITTAKFDVRLTTTDGIEEKDLPEGIMGINLEGSNAVPMTQEEGMSLEPYKFVVQNRGSVEASYKLTLEDIEGITNTLNDQYIRYNLIEKDYYDYKEYHEGDLPKGMFSTEYNYESESQQLKSPKLSETTNRVLDETTLMPNECIEYTLNLWIDENATTEQASEKEFSAKIKVDATQASIFNEGKAGEDIDYTYYNDGTLILTGTGAMNGIIPNEDYSSIEFNNNGNPSTSIIYNYLIKKGLDFLGEINSDNFSVFEGFATALINPNSRFANEGSSSGTYDIFTEEQIDRCYGGRSSSSACDIIGNMGTYYTEAELKQILRYFNEIPPINRIIIQEGITLVSFYSALSTQNGMVSLPNTLETIESDGIQGTILIIPNSVREVQTGAIDALKIYIDNTEEFVTNNWESEWTSSKETVTYLR